jgi:hypothetical protein
MSTFEDHLRFYAKLLRNELGDTPDPQKEQVETSETEVVVYTDWLWEVVHLLETAATRLEEGA